MENAIALGTFDGVHLGHKAVLSLPDNCRKIAVTFKKPPKSVLGRETSLITNFEAKKKILENIGIEKIDVLDFEAIKDMSPIEFLEFLYSKYHPVLISCGFNYKFGKNASGNVDTLAQFCKEKGIILECKEPISFGGSVVSSTAIREMIKNGEIEKANELLSYPFSFEATVLGGDKRGRTIGFPTINQKYPAELVVPKFGVYKTKTVIENKLYESITYIGNRPSFASEYIISETNILDFSGDLYGKEIKIILIKFLREELKFSSVEELKNQINRDLGRN